jgi:hypothetical protein
MPGAVPVNGIKSVHRIVQQRKISRILYYPSLMPIPYKNKPCLMHTPDVSTLFSMKLAYERSLLCLHCCIDCKRMNDLRRCRDAQSCRISTSANKRQQWPLLGQPRLRRRGCYKCARLCRSTLGRDQLPQNPNRPVFKTAATNSETIRIMIHGASPLRCAHPRWPKTSRPRVPQQKLKAFSSAPGCKRLAFLPCAKPPRAYDSSIISIAPIYSIHQWSISV